MLVRITNEFAGAYLAYPINTRIEAKYAQHMEEWTGHKDGSVYFQGDWELPETIRGNRQFTELMKGWNITIQVDPWEYGHWLGWDACNVEV